MLNNKTAEERGQLSLLADLGLQGYMGQNIEAWSVECSCSGGRCLSYQLCVTIPVPSVTGHKAEFPSLIPPPPPPPPPSCPCVTLVVFPLTCHGNDILSSFSSISLLYLSFTECQFFFRMLGSFGECGEFLLLYVHVWVAYLRLLTVCVCARACARVFPRSSSYTQHVASTFSEDT